MFKLTIPILGAALSVSDLRIATRSDTRVTFDPSTLVIRDEMGVLLRVGLNNIFFDIPTGGFFADLDLSVPGAIIDTRGSPFLAEYLAAPERRLQLLSPRAAGGLFMDSDRFQADGQTINSHSDGQTTAPDFVNGIVPTNYTSGGGGKFLPSTTMGVSIIRLDLSGRADTGNVTSFSDTSSINGSISIFNHSTRTLIESVSFSSLGGRFLGGGDLALNGIGSARVDGVLTNIEFNFSKRSGVITFEIRNSDTGVILADGVGETGRSELELTITP